MSGSIINQARLKRLRVFSLIEGVSTLLLFFVAMPLKYLAGMPLAVTLVGAVHGGLFLALLLLLLLGIRGVPLGTRLALLGAVAAVIPFGPFLFELKLRRLTVPG